MKTAQDLVDELETLIGQRGNLEVRMTDDSDPTLEVMEGSPDEDEEEVIVIS